METCNVCGEPAEYTCQRCEEYVCEDCTVAMTYHNQMTETRCSSCSPDEPTMGECNKPLKPKPKTMEAITELKVGMDLPLDVLIAWAPTLSFTNDGETRRIQDFFSSGAKAKLLGGNSIITAGFVEFYNKFYNLVPQTMEKMEDYCNTVIYIDSVAQGKAVVEKLVSFGFTWEGRPDSNTAYIRTEAFPKKTLSSGLEKGSWKGYLRNPKELTAEQFLGIKQQPMEINFKKGDQIKVWIGDNPDLHKKVYDKLMSFGLKDANGRVAGEKRHALYTYSGGMIAHSSDEKFFRDSPDYRLMTIAELFPEERINTNNHILNTKTNGKIIVSRKATTVTIGQRPTGRPVSGRTSRITITVGHLSNQAIRSGF